MLNRDFKEFAESLNARGVEYLVVGGYALAAHGHPRYTGDIDFWVRPTADNLTRLLDALTDFGFGSLGSGKPLRLLLPGVKRLTCHPFGCRPKS